MTTLNFLLAAAMLPAAIGCTTLDTDSDPQALGWGPSSFPATVMSAYASTADGISVQWNEHGGNGTTILERQTFDITGAAQGGFSEVARWTSSAAGTHTYYDPAAIGGVVRAKTIVPLPRPVRFAPDTQVVYRIIELPTDVTTCLNTTTGTCSFTSTTAYLPKATKYSVGRMQLRIKTTQGAANPSTLHVRAEVNPYAETWLDSTHANFSTNSWLPYDLSTSGITGLQDIQYINVWTPDADGFCIGEVTLILDGATAFDQQYPTCVWVKNGSALDVPFATIRSNALWKTFAPDTYLNQTPPITFIGFDAAGFAAHLDSILGSQLRVHLSSAGVAARLGATTALTRRNASHLHVQQHIKDLSVTWNNTNFGTIDANPSYDLVIHHADSTCAGWCVHVENFDGGAGYSGITGWFLSAIGIDALISYEVNDALADSFKSNATTLTPPSPFTFCFPDPNTTVSITNPAAGRSVTDQGHAVVWDSGSLTICGAGFNP